MSVPWRLSVHLQPVHFEIDMKIFFVVTAVLVLSAFNPTAMAQQTRGTVISVSGSGEVRADNDVAHASFFIEEQDKDKLKEFIERRRAISIKPTSQKSLIKF